MKNKVKTAVVTSVLVLSLGLGAGQVYASSVLGSNIIDLIRTQFTAITGSYTGKTNSSMDASKSAATTDIDKHVADKAGKTLDELDQFKQSEVQKGTTDINNYADQIKQETDAAIDAEKDKTKTAITNQVNAKVSETESAIEAQLQQSIKNNLQPRP